MFVSDTPILHADVDAFFASVAQRDDPSLRGRPVIVGPGVVMAASYEAKARGIKSGMGAGRARRLCPEAVVVSPRFEAYVAASKELFAIFEDTAPTVEGLGFEEAFLDVSGLERISGTPEQIAARLRCRVRDEAGLPITVGVARTKILAKLASCAAKPDGLLVVPPDGELDFLLPLRVEQIWGVGPATAGRLHDAGIGIVREAAERSEEALVAILGPAAGRYVYAISRNRDPRRVRRRRSRRSFGAQRALGRSPKTPESIDATLIGLVDRVTRRMRAKGRAGRTVVLRLRYSDYSRASRSHTLPRATAANRPILEALRSLMAAAAPDVERRGLTLVGLTVTNLDRRATTQLALPLDDPDDALDAVVDDLRGRFGSDAVTRAVLVDFGPPRSPEE